MSTAWFPEYNLYLNSKEGQKVSNIFQAFFSSLLNQKVELSLLLVLGYSNKSGFSLSTVLPPIQLYHFTHTHTHHPQMRKTKAHKPATKFLWSWRLNLLNLLIQTMQTGIKLRVLWYFFWKCLKTEAINSLKSYQDSIKESRQSAARWEEIVQCLWHVN